LAHEVVVLPQAIESCRAKRDFIDAVNKGVLMGLPPRPDRDVEITGRHAYAPRVATRKS